jgi:hypothetical protein
MAFPSIIAGFHVKCYINGTLLGYITAVPQWVITTDQREAREIDSNIPAELMPGSYRVNGSFGILRGQDTGGLEGAGMVASAQDMLRQKYLTIELQNRLTDQIIFRAVQCAVTRQVWSISPKQLIQGSFDWVGTTFENEAKS